MHTMFIFQPAIRFRPSARVAAAAVHVAGDRPVLLAQEGPPAERVTIELEAALVGVAVPPRRSGRRLTPLRGAPVLPGHAGARLLDDLPHPFSRESEAGADGR